MTSIAPKTFHERLLLDTTPLPEAVVELIANEYIDRFEMQNQYSFIVRDIQRLFARCFRSFCDHHYITNHMFQSRHIERNWMTKYWHLKILAGENGVRRKLLKLERRRLELRSKMLAVGQVTTILGKRKR